MKGLKGAASHSGQRHLCWVSFPLVRYRQWGSDQRSKTSLLDDLRVRHDNRLSFSRMAGNWNFKNNPVTHSSTFYMRSFQMKTYLLFNYFMLCVCRCVLQRLFALLRYVMCAWLLSNGCSHHTCRFSRPLSCRLCHPKGFLDPQPWKRKADPPSSPRLLLLCSPSRPPSLSCLLPSPDCSDPPNLTLPPLSSFTSRTVRPVASSPRSSSAPGLSVQFHSSRLSCRRSSLS